MERRDFAHLQSAKRGALVPAETHRQPLLPYERQLIEALGISVEEYYQLKGDIDRAIRERGPEYEHIPDVRGDVTTVLINLAIGLLLTGAAVLLAPKPPKAQEQEEIKTKDLGNQRGRTRFNNTVGFDAAPQLAQLASRVPIPFGRYEQNSLDDPIDAETDLGTTGYPSGGFIVEPLLVWSRMLSNGSFQSLKVKCVVGQSGMDTPPTPDAIMLGGQPIKSFYEPNYAVWWASRAGDNRLLPSDIIAGDAAPQGEWNVPTLSGDYQPGFSATYSPSNATDFGVYDSIPNGGHWRVNWRVVSILQRSGTDDPGGRKGAEIDKIAGKNGGRGMKGTGRWYSTWCGLTKHNGQGGELPEVVNASIGDTFTYEIRSQQIDGKDIGLDSEDTGVTGEDINNQMNSIRERTDELLQTNEVFICNRTMMKVKNRPNKVFDSEAPEDMTYELEVISFVSQNREVGLSGTKAITRPVVFEGGEGMDNDYAKSTSWYPLHKVDIGEVSNTRPTEVTELGIRSQVWNQANGLCNFASVPSPEKLEDYNEDQYEITSGNMNKYMYRTSFFVLGVRPVSGAAGLDADGNDSSDSDETFDGFDTINGCLFAVRGNQPINQYNYIRVYHPSKTQYEFRLIPKDACNVHRYESFAGTGQQIYVLDAIGDPESYSETLTHYGTFRLQFNAIQLSTDKLFQLPEMTTERRTEGGGQRCDVDSFALEGQANANGDVGALGGGYQQGYYEQILGQLKEPGAPMGEGDRKQFGETVSEEFQFCDKGLCFTCKMTGTVMDYQTDQAFVDRNGTGKAWGGISVEILSYELDPDYEWDDEPSFADEVFETGQTYMDTRKLTKGWYPYQFNIENQDAFFVYRAAQTCFDIPVREISGRNFELFSQIKEISGYTEKTASCNNGPEHSIVYISESQDDNSLATYNQLSVLGIKLRTLNQVATFQQPQIYFKNGITVERLAPDAGQAATGPSNNFADALYFLLTRQGAGLGQELSDRLVDKDSFVHAAKFMETTRLRFDGAITDLVNLRSFATQLAPLYLCNFVIKNGKFALIPAIPTDSSGAMQTTPTISQYFNDSNIIDGSFEFNYLDQQDRQDFRAVIEYRDLPVNGLVEKRTMMVKWKDEPGTPPAQETIDGSQYVSRRGHAFIAARYLLSIRRRIDHTVQFKTLPQGIGIEPGDYIKITSEIAPVESVRNVVVREDLTLLSATVFADGDYVAGVYRQGSTGAIKETITVVDGKVTDPTLANALMNIPSVARRGGVYQIEKIALEEDGLVSITASHHPVYGQNAVDDDGNDISGQSKIVNDILHANRYVKFEVLE